MDKSGSAELLNADMNNYKVVSLDSSNSDSKSSSLNSKHGQESVCCVEMIRTVMSKSRNRHIYFLFIGKLGQGVSEQELLLVEFDVDGKCHIYFGEA